MTRLRQTSTVWVDPDTPIEVDPPRAYRSAVTAQPGRVPWIVRVGRDDLTLHVADQATLTRLRDAIDQAMRDHEAGDR